VNCSIFSELLGSPDLRRGRLPVSRRPNGVRGSDGHFPSHSNALLPSVALERVRIERLTLTLVVAAAAVPR
jgi:hypothetical protein